ncbi:hypothetical protein [Embleya sp. NPDC059259]|uniref:hypothetical protein n=1 Tax=unclassified Embleya TaxID=2699296 RepID=UPI003697C6EF
MSAPLGVGVPLTAHDAPAPLRPSPERGQLFDQILWFGEGFCRAHAVSFAVPALQSAWLMVGHPAALYAG